jgi:hypothetical protein
MPRYHLQPNLMTTKARVLKNARLDSNGIPTSYIVKIYEGDDDSETLTSVYDSSTLLLNVACDFIELVVKACDVDHVEFASNCYDLELAWRAMNKGRTG